MARKRNRGLLAKGRSSRPSRRGFGGGAPSPRRVSRKEREALGLRKASVRTSVAAFSEQAESKPAKQGGPVLKSPGGFPPSVRRRRMPERADTRVRELLARWSSAEALVCMRRKTRNEVMHATGAAGRTGPQRPHKPKSKVRC